MLESLQTKHERLGRLSRTISMNNVVALGVAESEREAQGVSFYLGRVTMAPKLARTTFRVGSGRNGWNVKAGEFYLDGWQHREAPPR